MIGISPANWGRADAAEPFVTRYGLTFVNLWDGTNAAYRHYGSPYTSEFWLLDRNGDRVGDRAVSFSNSRAQRMLSTLE